MNYILQEQNIFWSPAILLAQFLSIHFCVTLFAPYIRIENYADENTAHSVNKHLHLVLKDLEQGSDTLLKTIQR